MATPKVLMVWLQRVLLAILLILAAFSYHPLFLQSENFSLNLYVYAITLMLLALNFYPKRILNLRFLTTFLILVLVVVIAALLFSAVGLTVSYIAEIPVILLPCVLVVIGYNAPLTSRDWIAIVLIYCVSLIFVLSTQIMTNIGAFQIAEEYIMGSEKNAAGVMLAVAIVALLLLYFSKRDSLSLWLRVTTLALLAVLLLVVVTLRARAAILTVVICAFFALLQMRRFHKETRYYRYLKLLGGGAILLLLLLLVSGFPLLSIYDYFYDSFFLNKTGDFSSGRMDRNIAAIEVLRESPVWGRMVYNVDIKWVHNYLLLKLSDYGIVGALPLLLPYFYLIFFTVKSHLQRNSFTFESIGYWVLLVLLIISLVEPSLPYAPGTAVTLAYLLLGYSLREAVAENEKKRNINTKTVTL